MAENSERDWLRTLAPYVVALAGAAAAGVGMTAAAKVAPVEQRVAALEARDAADHEALSEIRKDIRQIRDHLSRWDDDRRRGRWLSPPDEEQEK